MEVGLGASLQESSPMEVFSSVAPVTVTVTSSPLNNFITQDGFSLYSSTAVDTHYAQPSGYFASSADQSSLYFSDTEGATYLSATSYESNPRVFSDPSAAIDETNSYIPSITTPWLVTSTVAPYAPSSSLLWNPDVNTDLGWNPESVISSTNPISLDSSPNIITDGSSSYADPSIGSDWWLTISEGFYGSSSGTFSMWTPTPSEAIASATSNYILNSVPSIVYDPSTWTTGNGIQNSHSYVYPPTSTTLQLTEPSFVSGSNGESYNMEFSSSSLSIGDTSAYSYLSQYPSMGGYSYVSPAAESYASIYDSYYPSSHVAYYSTYPTPNLFSSSYSYWESTSSPLSGWYSSWFLSPPTTLLPSASSEASIITTPYPSVVPSSIVSFSAPRPPISLSTPTPTAFVSDLSTSVIPTLLTYPISSPLIDTTSSSSYYEDNIYSSSEWQPSIGSEITPSTSSSLTPTFVATTFNIVPTTTSSLPSTSMQVTDDSAGYQTASSTSVELQSDSYVDGFTTASSVVYPSVLQTVTSSSAYESLSSTSNLANIENAISPSLSPSPFSSYESLSSTSSLVNIESAISPSLSPSPFSSYESLSSTSNLVNIESAISPSLSPSPFSSYESLSSTSSLVNIESAISPSLSPSPFSSYESFSSTSSLANIESAISPSLSPSPFSSYESLSSTSSLVNIESAISPSLSPSPFSSYESLSSTSNLANIENAISPSLSPSPSSSAVIGSISASLSQTSDSSPGSQGITTTGILSTSQAITTSISSLSMQAIMASSSSSGLESTTATSSSPSRLQITTSSSSSRLRAIATFSSSSRLQDTTTFSFSTPSTIQLASTSPSTSLILETIRSSSSLPITSSSSSTSSTLGATRSSSSFFSRQPQSPYFPTSGNSSSYRSSISTIRLRSTSSTSNYKSLAPSKPRNDTSTSRSTSSINTGYSVSYGTKTAYYIYTQKYVITGSSTTFGTGIPTTVNEPLSMSTTFSAPKTIITQNFAFYEHLLHDLRNGDDHDHDHSHTGAIVGGVVGGVCGFVVGCIVIAMFLFHRLRKKKRKNTGPGEFACEIGSRLADRTPPRTSSDNLQEKPDDSPDINPREENEQLSSRIPRGSLDGQRANAENPFRDEFNFEGRLSSQAQRRPPPVPPPRKMHSTSQHPIQSRNANVSRDVRSSLVSSLGDSSLGSSLQAECSTLSSGAIRLEPSSYGGSIPEDPGGGFFREII